MKCGGISHQYLRWILLTSALLGILVIHEGDCEWSAWSQWSKCSVTCGEGFKRRYRECTNKKGCEGRPVRAAKCSAPFECPENKRPWSEWTDWSACSVTCGQGRRSRTRECSSLGGISCQGENFEMRICKDLAICPQNGTWSEWTDWSICSVTCGQGLRTRSRECSEPKFGGLDCEGETIETATCTSLVMCPLHGSWSEWSEWGDCESDSCGDGASRSFRHRTCNNPIPKHRGSMCQGVFLDAGTCGYPTNCRVDGDWSEWSQWDCTESLVKRTRTCNNPPPSNGGDPCHPDDPVQFFNSTDQKYRDECGHKGDENEEDIDEEEENYDDENSN